MFADANRFQSSEQWRDCNFLSFYLRLYQCSGNTAGPAALSCGRTSSGRFFKKAIYMNTSFFFLFFFYMNTSCYFQFCKNRHTYYQIQFSFGWFPFHQECRASYSTQTRFRFLQHQTPQLELTTARVYDALLLIPAKTWSRSPILL